MLEITDKNELDEFLKQEFAVLFYDADWSMYAVISKQMIAFVEQQALQAKLDVSFYYGQFEEERVSLVDALVAAGVSGDVVSRGSGSLSFFRRGKHMTTMVSVVGEGTWAVWREFQKAFGMRP